MEPSPLGGAMIDAWLERYSDLAAPPLAQCSYARRATANPCNNPSAVRVGLRAPRRSPGPQYMPRSASPGDCHLRAVPLFCRSSLVRRLTHRITSLPGLSLTPPRQCWYSSDLYTTESALYTQASSMRFLLPLVALCAFSSAPLRASDLFDITLTGTSGSGTLTTDGICAACEPGAGLLSLTINIGQDSGMNAL